MPSFLVINGDKCWSSANVSGYCRSHCHSTPTVLVPIMHRFPAFRSKDALGKSHRRHSRVEKEQVEGSFVVCSSLGRLVFLVVIQTITLEADKESSKGWDRLSRLVQKPMALSSVPLRGIHGPCGRCKANSSADATKATTPNAFACSESQSCIRAVLFFYHPPPSSIQYSSNQKDSGGSALVATPRYRVFPLSTDNDGYPSWERKLIHDTLTPAQWANFHRIYALC